MHSLPYRKNVQMWLFNEKGDLLVIDESTEKEVYWKFPQGGVDNDESNEKAVKRELAEELCIKKYETIKKAKYIHRYNWNNELQKKKGFRGQEQNIYLIRLKDKKQVKIGEEKIRRYKWLPFSKLIKKFSIPNQIEAAEKVWEEFGPIIEKETN